MYNTNTEEDCRSSSYLKGYEYFNVLECGKKFRLSLVPGWEVIKIEKTSVCCCSCSLFIVNRAFRYGC